MSRIDVLNILRKEKVISIVRLEEPKKIVPVIEALIEGGIRIVEITMTTTDPLMTFRKAVKHFSRDVILGVGSVVDEMTAQQMILEGAQLIITPTNRRETIETAHRYDIPILSGVLTPEEILRAYEYGADMAKIYPAAFFGPNYIKAIKDPMPQVDLIASGGIGVKDVVDWIKAGASGVGLGSALSHRGLVKKEDYEGITANAKKVTKLVRSLK